MQFSNDFWQPLIAKLDEVCKEAAELELKAERLQQIVDYLYLNSKSATNAETPKSTITPSSSLLFKQANSLAFFVEDGEQVAVGATTYGLSGSRWRKSNSGLISSRSIF